MRTRLLAIVLLVAAPVVGAACGGGGDITKSGDPVPATASASSGSTGSSGSTDDSTSPEDGSGEGSSDSGSGDVAADPAKCVELTSAFAKIAASGATVTDDQAQAAFDELTKVFPPDLADDLQTLVEAYADGGASSLSSPEFMAANRALTDYLSAVCGAPR